MAKHKEDPDEESPHKKRRKLTKGLKAKQEPVSIQTSKDLQSLLAFDQNVGPRARQNIQSFRSFIESFAYGRESDDRTIKRALLLEYLQSQARSHAEESMCLADIIKTWHFAAQSNAEGLFSAIAAVLALLLKTISSSIEFRIWGNHLCKTLLQEDQIQLFNRGLTANKTKEHLIAPCLRLLTEIVSFDGGHAARSVFRHRETTFNRLETFLVMRMSAHAQNRKRPSLRDNALHYLYVNLRLQNSAAKMSIIAQGKIVRAWFEDVIEDSPSTILQMLDVLKRDIALDPKLSTSAKSRFFSDWLLGRLATLYSYQETERLPEGCQSVQKSTHELLQFLCTSPGLGVLDARNGEAQNVNSSAADGTTWKAQNWSKPKAPFKDNESTNSDLKLASFLQTLRPYANVLQKDLIIAVFRNTPKLVSDYFLMSRSFSFEPKATATWLGYSSFLLAILQIPPPNSLIPKSVNDPVPPSYATVIESIIPHPMTQKVMTRCLNQNSDLIKFLSTRILTAAFKKLALVLRKFEDVHYCTDEKHCAVAWDQAASQLTIEFCRRVPDMEVVIAQFRKCPRDNVMLRESISRLLALYYEVAPQLALEQIFDISVALSTALGHKDLQIGSPEENGIRLLELKHLLSIAHWSPNMQWFHKPDAMWLSPFTMLLKMHHGRRRADPIFYEIEGVLGPVAVENQILQSRSSLEALILSLQDSIDFMASNKVFEFLDNCILRLVRRPVHYYDIFSSLIAAVTPGVNASNVRIDLLLVAIMEQWPFLAKSADPPAMSNVSTWSVRYIEFTMLTATCNDTIVLNGAETKILQQIRKQILKETQNKASRAMLKKALKEPPELGLSEEIVAHGQAKNRKHVAKPNSDIDAVRPKPSIESMSPGPPQEHEDHPGLSRWARQDIEDAISDGAIAELFLCLCSKHSEIRKQALHSVRTFTEKLEASGYSEWRHSFLLVGELVETARETLSDIALPFFAGVLAARLLSVLADPLHFMYEKANKFLNKGPQWNLKKLPSYWVDKILLNPPIEEEAHYQELEWLLDTLVDGLRTPADMELYRHCNILERLLSLSASPLLPEPCFQTLLDLLFRCTYIDGSSTLITRCGIISWIASLLALKSTNEPVKMRLRTLASRVIETSDQNRVKEWSSGTLASMLDKIQINKKLMSTGLT